MMKEDPEAAQFEIVQFQPGECRPSKRSFLHIDDLKVTRTYSLISTLSHIMDSGVSIRNKVFSDISPGTLLTYNLVQTDNDEPVKWRTGYYDKPRTWEEEGPKAGEANSITRRFSEQKSHRPHASIKARPSFLDACSSKARSLGKAAAKKRRKLKALRGEDDSDSDGSSSSTSSSSSSNSSSSSGSG